MTQRSSLGASRARISCALTRCYPPIKRVYPLAPIHRSGTKMTPRPRGRSEITTTTSLFFERSWNLSGSRSKMSSASLSISLKHAFPCRPVAALHLRPAAPPQHGIPAPSLLPSPLSGLLPGHKPDTTRDGEVPASQTRNRSSRIQRPEASVLDGPAGLIGGVSRLTETGPSPPDQDAPRRPQSRWADAPMAPGSVARAISIASGSTRRCGFDLKE